MADGRAANATSIILIRALVYLGVLLVGLLWPAIGFAQDDIDLSVLNARALSAYNAGDHEKARALVAEGLAADQATRDAQPIAFLETWNNLLFLQMQSDPHAPDLFEIIAEAKDFAARHDLSRSTQAASSSLYEINLLRQLGEVAQAAKTTDEALALFRGTEAHAQLVVLATDVYFDAERYRDMNVTMREMITLTGRSFAEADMEVLSQRNDVLEEAGDIDAVTQLLEARLQLVAVYAPDSLTFFERQGHWTIFYMNHQAENFGTAARALRAWAAVGTATREEQDFIDFQAEQSLLLTQLSGYGDRSEVQLGYAQLAVAFAELASARDPIQIALALRERAYAENAIGQLVASEATLQDALGLLAEGKGGVAHRFLVLEDLASLAWERGDIDISADLFQRAASAYDAALAAGVPPLADYDQSVLLANRAKLAIAREEPGEVERLLAQAQDMFARAAAGPLKANQRVHQATLLSIESEIALLAGDNARARSAVLSSLAIASEIYPAGHPDRILAITNAADTLFVAGDAASAVNLLDEATNLARQSLPKDALLRTEISLKSALASLALGDRQAAQAALRGVVGARKSPVFRSSLPEAAGDFELLAWSLLGQDTQPSPAQLDEVLDAIQWTQSSGSAEALTMMQDRLAAADPIQRGLIRQRQDLLLEHTDLRSSLTASFAAGDAQSEVQRALRKRIDGLAVAIADADVELAVLGLGSAGVTSIDSLSVEEIQDHLKPGEVLVTFLLPGLQTNRIEGLDVSANRTIAIGKTSVEIAVIPEASRGALNDKISAFRCEMAVNENGCGHGSIAPSRGAFSLDDEAEETAFDWQTAHALYDDLFGGIQSSLDDADHVIISPPGDLLRLPFHALITRPQANFSLSTADWMIRHHAVSVLPSIPSLALLRRDDANTKSAGSRFLGIGDPVIGNAPDVSCTDITTTQLRASDGIEGNVFEARFEDGMRLANPDRLRALSRLPDASCEVKSIAATFAPSARKLLLRESATETAIKELSASGELSGFDAIVFATHGLVSGETSAVAPGLVLTPPTDPTRHDDGLLTAAEIATLEIDADLVVLSACNTAAGSDAVEEGLSGIARGFFHAGARALIVTHWAVYSEAAVEMTTSIFAAQAHDPQLSNPAALRSAVLATINDPLSPEFKRHPSYWAPFALVGL